MKKLFIYLYILFGYTLTFSQSDKTFFIRGNLNIKTMGLIGSHFFLEISHHLFQIFNRRRATSISPLIRYELDGFQPWGFDIWWDYKIKKSGKFNFSIGGVFPGIVN